MVRDRLRRNTGAIVIHVGDVGGLTHGWPLLQHWFQIEGRGLTERQRERQKGSKSTGRFAVLVLGDEGVEHRTSSVPGQTLRYANFPQVLVKYFVLRDVLAARFMTYLATQPTVSTNHRCHVTSITRTHGKVR